MIKSRGDQAPACITKAERIHAAARSLFMTDGYRATSMDQIARQADVSKTTLYAYFASKEALFLAIIEEEKRRFGVYIPEDLPDGEIDVRGMLEDIGRSLVELMTDQSVMGFFRSVLAESGQAPEIGRAIWEAGPRRFARRIAALLERLAARGFLKIDDPALATVRFLALIRGETHLHCLMDCQYKMDKTAIAHDVVQSVDFFLAYYQ